MNAPLILLPAMMCDARLFAAQIAPLSMERPVMVAPLMGERIEDMASAVMTNAPQRFALAGVGLGGMVAMEITRRVPERVTRLAFIGTSPLPEPPNAAADRETQIVAARAGRLDEIMEEVMPPQGFYPGPDRMAVLALVQDMARTLGPEAFVRHSRAMQRRKDQQAVMRKVRQPALVMCGAHDEVYTEKRHRFMSELIPYSEIAVIEEAGHLPPIEAPAQVTEALLGWLNQPLVLR